MAEKEEVKDEQVADQIEDLFLDTIFVSEKSVVGED